MKLVHTLKIKLRLNSWYSITSRKIYIRLYWLPWITAVDHHGVSIKNRAILRMIFWLVMTTDYGRPMKPFFSEILNFWAWADKLGRQIGQINSGVFSAKLSAPILVQWIPCTCFPLFNHYFYKKLSLLYPNPKYSFGIGIWIWAAKN